MDWRRVPSEGPSLWRITMHSPGVPFPKGEHAEDVVRPNQSDRNAAGIVRRKVPTTIPKTRLDRLHERNETCCATTTSPRLPHGRELPAIVPVRRPFQQPTYRFESSSWPAALAQHRVQRVH